MRARRLRWRDAQESVSDRGLLPATKHVHTCATSELSFPYSMTSIVPRFLHDWFAIDMGYACILSHDNARVARRRALGTLKRAAHRGVGPRKGVQVSRHKRERHLRWGAIVGALVLATTGMLVGVTPAYAADVSSQVVGSVTLTNTSETTANRVGDTIRATYVIDSQGQPVAAGDTFTLSFPSLFSATAGSLAMNDGTGTALANCTVTAGTSPVMTCTFTAYASTLSFVQGSAFFAMKTVAETTETTVTIQVGSTSTLVTLPGGLPIGPAPGDGGIAIPPSTSTKLGWQEAGNYVYFGFKILASEFASSDTINIHDALPAGFVYYPAIELPSIWYFSSYDDWATNYKWNLSGKVFYLGYTLPEGGGTWTVTPSNGGTVVDISLPNFDPGRDGYYIVYFPTLASGIPDGTYENTATVNGVSVATTVNFSNAYGGSLWGPGTGGLAITKQVDGAAAADVPADQQFTLTATMSTGETQTLTVTAGVPLPLTFASGTVVTLTEVTPAAGGTYTWGTPRFSSTSTGVTISSDGTSAAVTIQEQANVAVTLTNTATPTAAPVMNLVLAKSLVGSGPWHPGDVVSFVLTPSNEGPDAAAAGWSVTDVMPAGLTLTGMSGSGYACVVATATCTADAGLAAGANGAVITVSATVDASFTGTAHNVAYVSPAAGDIAETNTLVVPTSSTDTSSTATDNDAQADLTVAAADAATITILASTGSPVGSAALVVAGLCCLAGAALMMVARRKVSRGSRG